MERYSLLISPIGRIVLVYSEFGLRRIEIWEGGGIEDLLPGIWRLVRDDEGAKGYATQLREYFEGARRSFDIELDLRGTGFQLMVWREIAKIPYGEVRSYKEVATSIGMPRAYRAVGRACRANPIPIVVPCHRVVSKGGLGGYSLGTWRKVWLLRHEGAIA